MSNHAINWAYKQPVKVSGEKFVLVAVADFADESGSCFPSQEKLARMTGQSVSSVNRHLKNLGAAGYLTRKHRYDEFGKRTSDRFYLSLTTWHDAMKDAEGEPLHRNIEATTSHRDADYIAQCESNPQEPPRTPSSTSTSAVEQIAHQGAFDEFWREYPRKVGKLDARKVFDRRAKDTDPDLIVAGAARFAHDPNRVPEFTPHPTTWLSRGGWDDDPEPVRGAAARVSPSDQRAAANLALLAQYTDAEKRQAIQ